MAMKESGVPGMSIGDRAWVHDFGHLVLRWVRSDVRFGNGLSVVDFSLVSLCRRIGFFLDAEFTNWNDFTAQVGLREIKWGKGIEIGVADHLKEREGLCVRAFV